MTSDHARVARVKRIFDRWAEVGRAEGMELGHGPSARPAFDRLGLTAGTQYLDVGCGNGYTVRWASELVGEGSAVGIDLSPQMVARARAMSEPRPNVEFHVAAFPTHGLGAVLRPGRFDAVFSMEVLYYLPDVDAGLREIATLLRPGGHFACVVDFYAENEASHGWPDDLDCPMTLLDAEGWRCAFENAGLQVLEQTRLRRSPGEGVDAWKVQEGSLLTLGQRAGAG